MGSLVISPFSFLKLVTCVFSLYFFAELECYLKCPQVIQEVGSVSSQGACYAVWFQPAELEAFAGLFPSAARGAT